LVSITQVNNIKDTEINKVVYCNAFNCSKNATKKINVSVGSFGAISLDLCNNCVRKFVQKDKGNENLE